MDFWKVRFRLVDVCGILDGCGSVLRLCVNNCGVLYSEQACGYLVCEFD